MKANTRHRGPYGSATFLLLIIAIVAMPMAWAGTTVTYTGQGFNFDGTTYNLNDERCGLTGQNDADDGSTGQFADWNGPGQPYQTGQGYLVWVLTANGATSATLTLPGGTTVQMYRVGGTYKYASPYYLYASLIGPPAVTATYEGRAKGNVQLVVSHGCKPYVDEEKGAWCSPGYWKNAQVAAWELIGFVGGDGYTARDAGMAAFFNLTVVPTHYATPSPANPTLGTVLNTPGANTFGGPDAPFGENAFNATAAWLTSQIPGYQFDPIVKAEGGELACPIDNHGNWKVLD